MNIHLCSNYKRDLWYGMVCMLDLDVCVVTETWIKEGVNLVSKTIDNRQYQWFSRERQKQKARSGEGGVGVLVKRNIGEVSVVDRSKEFDMMWIEIDRPSCKMYIAVVYISPEGSPRANDSSMQLAELEAKILHFKTKGQVIVLGDFNARIGMLESSCIRDGRRIFLSRTIQDTNVNALAKDRGMQMIESMNACNMVIMNGIDSGGEFTCINGYRGKSVIDYIILDEDILPRQEKSESIRYVERSMKVWEEEFANISDHRLITCQLQLPEGMNEVVELEREAGSQTRKVQGWRRRDKGDRTFWEKMEEEGEIIMGEWVRTSDEKKPGAEIQDNKQAVEMFLESYQESLNEVLDRGLGRKQKRIATAKQRKEFVFNPIINEAVWEERQALRNWKASREEEKLKEDYKNKKKHRKKLVRNQERMNNRKIVENIEKLRSKNPKEYWEQLKKLSNVEEKQQLPNKMKNEVGEWVCDKQGIQEIWARAFKKLGSDNGESKFDEVFAEQVRKRMKVKVRKWNYIGDVVDGEIQLAEVKTAIKKLKRGKATGVDNYMNEIFMYGGEQVEQATWILCQEIFHREAYPKAWAQGLIFPIFKGGPKKDRFDPLKYRGITLLSVLGKIYASVLNERVTKWIEQKGVLVEEQAGFRKGRSTVDQLFILAEMIRNRRPRPTYVCFIDIQKAYDRVWREGLWDKLYDYGMTGKMWRVLRSIYDSVEGSVLVNDTQTRFFDIEMGLRQGCILSPILFAIYINGLAEEIRRANLGAQIVKYQDGKLGILMFADDVALVADNRQELQELLDVTYKYSLKWRMTFNYEKCAVVVFRTTFYNDYQYGDCVTECTCGLHWRLGEQLIREVSSYKYLGVELDRSLSFQEFKKRTREKARKNVSRVWYMGMYDGCLSVKACINLYQALVRSVLEYGCEIWGDENWEEGERVQREMGRRILRCNGKTTNEAVLGELGWWRLRTRRDFCKLKYWIKILTMDDTRLVRKIYRVSKHKYMSEGTNNWCKMIHSLAAKYNLLDLWTDESLIHQHEENTRDIWINIVFNKVQAVEQEQWLKAIDKKPKLRTYRTFKSKLELEPYLLSGTQKTARYLLTSIRTGTNKLRIETGRWKRPKEPVEERVCKACMSGAIEDEKHFVLDCKAYASLRHCMIDTIRVKTHNRYNLHLDNTDQTWIKLMQPHDKKKEINEALKEYLKAAWKQRMLIIEE